MKKIKILSVLLLSLTLFFGCKKEGGSYPGGVVSPYISIFDIKDLYKGEDVTLTKERMYGSSSIAAMVVSDHSGGNMPAGLLVVQEARRLSQLRGISINIGADAANYVPGDSVIVNLEGAVLKRVNGILQITGVPTSAITKVSSGNAVRVDRVPADLILAKPEIYESVLSVIVKGGFNPVPAAGDVLAGDKILNDGFGNLGMHTEATAKFAGSTPVFLANYYGIIFNTIEKDTLIVPHLRVRTQNDIVLLSSKVQVTPIIITGFISDVKGADQPYEYVQLMATRDITFNTTDNAFSLVTTNNANASTPTGYPAKGWGTGGLRTYKFNLTSGSVRKGEFFYVGGSGQMINGAASTSMASSKWIRSFNYSTTNGDDGVGTKTNGIFANSGNASGVAVLPGTNLTESTEPVDVLFVGTGGSLYTVTPVPIGYRITNTDWYDVKNAITLEDQPYIRQGTNTRAMNYTTSDVGYFYMMGGEYNITLGRWTKVRNQNSIILEKTSPVSLIEGEGSTKLVQ